MQKHFKPTDEELSEEVRRRLSEDTPDSLFLAISVNRPLVVKRILDSNVVRADSLNESGATGLHMAALKGFADCGRALCGAGADPNRLWEGSTPLHLATSESYSDFCSMIIQHGADLNIRDALGFTPLHLAAMRNNRLLATLFIDAGADPSAPDGDGKTVAQRWNFNAAHPECRKHLVSNSGFDDSETSHAMQGTASSANSRAEPVVVDKVLLQRFKTFRTFREEKRVKILPENIPSLEYHRTIETRELRDLFLRLDSMGMPLDMYTKQIDAHIADGLRLRARESTPNTITFEQFAVIWLRAHSKGWI